MKNQPTQNSPLTLAEICEAIDEGRLNPAEENGYYTITHRALRQLRPDLARANRQPTQFPQRPEQSERIAG